MGYDPLLRIQQTPLFQCVSGVRDLQHLAEVAQVRFVKRGETVITQGAQAVELAIIVAGEARVCFNDQSVESLRLHRGSLFGEMEYFEPSSSLATVVAVTDCELLTIAHADLERLTASNPHLLIQLNRGFLKTLTEKHRLVTDSLIELKLDSEPSSKASAAHRPQLQGNARKNAGARPHTEAAIATAIPGAVGNSKPMMELRGLVERIKRHQGNVLILGEAGVGKELVASALVRRASGEPKVPFVAVDSATLTSATVESILFGHERGSFTGADRKHVGLFERANGGVIYFDEIGNMPAEVQAKLLRVIQEKEVLPVGGAKPIPLKFRVIAATNLDLEKACSAGLFRFDLYSRLSVFELHVAPLRERREDIVPLVEFFLQMSGSAQPLPSIDAAAQQCLTEYDWPGNIRELKNVLEYAIAMTDGPIITHDALPAKLTHFNCGSTQSVDSLHAMMEQAETKILRAEYQRAAGNVSQLARNLKTDRSSLHRKLKQYGIHEV